LTLDNALIADSVFRLAARRTELCAMAPQQETAPVSEKRYSLSRGRSYGVRRPMTDGVTQIACGVIKHLRRFAVPALALGVCALLLVAAQDLTKTLDYHAVVKTLRRMPSAQLI
jgi:hypothetical protein